jgi:hypothetical protein
MSWSWKLEEVCLSSFHFCVPFVQYSIQDPEAQKHPSIFSLHNTIYIKLRFFTKSQWTLHNLLLCILKTILSFKGGILISSYHIQFLFYPFFSRLTCSGTNLHQITRNNPFFSNTVSALAGRKGYLIPLPRARPVTHCHIIHSK